TLRLFQMRPVAFPDDPPAALQVGLFGCLNRRPARPWTGQRLAREASAHFVYGWISCYQISFCRDKFIGFLYRGNLFPDMRFQLINEFIQLLKPLFVSALFVFPETQDIGSVHRTVLLEKEIVFFRDRI